MSDLIYLAIGLVGLFFGGEWLVRGAVAIATGLRIPPLVIGLTLVGFGTSTPELVTSLQAALAGSPGIAVGNVVGSNIGNVLLILGLAAFLVPITVDARALSRDGTVLMAATVACLAVVLTGHVGRWTGLTFVAALAVYVVATIVIERRRESRAAAVYEAETDLVAETAAGWRAAVLALAGLIVLIVGARFLVTGAIGVSERAGLSEALIGLTIVAIGTSLPELVTSVIAVRRGQGDVAFGNIIGSNIFNILGILGVTAAVRPLAVPDEIARLDIWVMTAAALALVLLARSGWRVTRSEGGAMLAAYALYLGVLIALA
ncbi:MAG: calcium/sodium antiporter [Silicimonas sp.]|nr:calcium/sodium antiporter [Silicimonas sp.]